MTTNVHTATELPRADTLINAGTVAALVRRHIRALLRYWKVALTWFVVEPWIALLAVALGIGRLVGEMDSGLGYAQFVAPGIVIGTAMFHALGDAAWSAYDRVNQSVYETQLTAPVTVHELVLAEYLYAMLKALLSTLSVGGLAVVFGWIPLMAMPGLLLVSMGVGAVFAGIGQIFAAKAPSFHALTLVFSMIATPLYFFSGTFFPVALLPEWVLPIAWAAPLTPLVQIGRAIALDTLSLVHLACAIYVVAFAVTFYFLAVRAMRARLLK